MTVLHSLAAFFAAAAIAGTAYAAAPATSDPSGRLIAGFDQPGEFPVSVTAANLRITPEPGVELDGAGEDFLQIEFPSAGPIAWTESRHNSGDLALSIGPADPTDARYFPPASVVNNYQALNGNTNPIDPAATPTELTTLAWRVSNATGALFATPRRNVYVNDATTGYAVGGTPMGNLYGVSYFGDTFGQGWGFRMQDGVFANGGGDSADLITAAAGPSAGRHEASFDVSTVYLPYEQGWKGAWVNPGIDGPATFAYGSPGLDPSAVTWAGGSASITLPGINSATDGMLFVAPSNDSSTTRLASAFPNAQGGWTASLRLDDNADVTGQTLQTSGNNFQFVYLPYNAVNLIGGHVDGDDASLVNSAGGSLFDLTRSAEGAYELTVFAADGVTKKNGDNGMLMLSVAGALPTDGTKADRTFLSYEYDASKEAFVINSRELTATTGGTEDVFGNVFALRDSDFYFSWVDFATPLSLGGPTPLPGDANADGKVDLLDLDILGANFGLTGSATVAQGDFNSDANVDLLDLDILGANFGAMAASATAVPEPAGVVAAMAVVMAVGLRRRG